MFIGREQELLQLQGLWDEALVGNGKTVVIVGERGSGKRTLAHAAAESARKVAPEAINAFYECTRRCASYAPFTELVSSVLESDRLKYLPFVLDLGLAIGKAIPAVKDLVTAGEGLKKVVQDRAQAEHATVDVFYQFWLFVRRISQDRPLLFTVTNIHYLDDETIALLGYLATRIERSWVMFVATYDPDEVSTGGAIPTLISDLLPARRLERILLRPLTREDVLATLMERYGLADDSAATALHRHTAGNPFFLQELLDYLEDNAPEPTRGDGSFLRTSIELRGVPETIGTLLEARLSRLDSRLARTLQLAALEGPSFAPGTIAQMAEDVSEDEIYQHLEVLRRQHALIEPDENTSSSAERYRFTCDLLRQYLSTDGCRLSEHERRRLHEKIAQCYKQLYESGMHDDPLAIAENFEAAGCPREAAHWYMSASMDCAKRLDLSRASESADRALSLLGDCALASDPVYVEHLVQSANVDLLLSEVSNASRKAAEALQLASDTGDTRGKALSLELQGRLGFEAGAYPTAAECFASARKWFEMVSDDAGVCRTLGREGACYEKAGEIKKALGCYRRELSTARLWGDALASVRATKHLASASYEIGDYDAALDLADEALGILGGDQGSLDALESARVGLLLGTVLMRKHRYQDAEAHLRAASDAFRSIGYLRALTRTLSALGSSLCWQNRLIESEETLQQALAQAGDADPVERSQVLDLLGKTLMRQGRFDEAERLFRESLSIDTSVGLRLGEAESHFGLASLLVLKDNQDEALAHYERAMAIWSELNDEVELAHVYARIGSVYRKKNQLDKAEEWYRKSLRVSRQLGDELGEARSYRGLGKTALLKGEGDVAVDFLSRALPTIRQHMGPVETAGVLVPMGDAFAMQGQPDEARHVWKEARDLLDTQFDQAEVEVIDARLQEN